MTVARLAARRLQKRALLNKRDSPWWRGSSLLAYDAAAVVRIVLLWLRGAPATAPPRLAAGCDSPSPPRAAHGPRSSQPGYTYDEIGQAVGRSSSTCWRYVHKTLQHGGIYLSPINHGGRRHEIFGVRGRHLLCALVSRFRTLSLERYAEWMSRALGTIVTPDAVGKQLRGMGITSKVLEKLYAECAMQARCRARTRPRPHEPRARSLARSAGRSRPRPFDGLPPTRSS